jgi:S-DNA-T family DNA segregation ATPase FtsK/SpoIIIE
VTDQYSHEHINVSDSRGSDAFMGLLDAGFEKLEPKKTKYNEEAGNLLEQTLLGYGIKGEVVNIVPGPIVIRYEVVIAPGIATQVIHEQAADIARSMDVMDIRIVDVIHGSYAIGIEISNGNPDTIQISHVVGSEAFQATSALIPMALGCECSGNPVVIDLAKTQHLLMAGAIGSGKNVTLHLMLTSMLLKKSPKDVKLLLIDPKAIELSAYDDLPHLLSPVINDISKANKALQWCLAEVERRHELLKHHEARNIGSYNREQAASLASQDKTEVLKLPYIVVVIDDYSDLIIIDNELDILIAKVVQKASAVGVHLIITTQHPTPNIITSVIKACIPARIAFRVNKPNESCAILDQKGAETLLGFGDMLFLPAGKGVPERIHGAFVRDHEVDRVVQKHKVFGVSEYFNLGAHS